MSDEIDFTFLELSEKQILKAKELEAKIKGNNLYIYMDDTSNTSKQKTNEIIDKTAKTYIALVLDNNQKSFLLNNTYTLVESLKKDNKNEFHFVDIYNHQNEWKDISVEEIKDIFELFSKLLINAEAPFFIQSIDKDIKEKVTEILNDSNIKSHLKENKLSSLNYEIIPIIALLKQIDDALKSQNLKYDNIYITIDEGVLKKGTKLTLLGNLFKETSDHAYISFESTKDNTLLQFADFIAYSFLRHQFLNKKVIDKKEDFFNDPFYSSIYNSINKVMNLCMSENFKYILLDDLDTNKIKKTYKKYKITLFILYFFYFFNRFYIF